MKVFGERPRIVWTIAGFDPSGGAGITADLLTFAAHGLYGCSAITALTVQSTQGVSRSERVTPALLAETLAHLYEDMPPAGIKIGMLGGPEIMGVVARFLQDITPLQAASTGPRRLPVVLDPVLRSSSGRELFPVSALPQLRQELLPLVDFITPNWVELAALTDREVTNLDQAEAAARSLGNSFPRLNIVTTGGDQASPTDLLLTSIGEIFRFPGEHIATNSTHGTGCAFSSALLANLACGTEPRAAVEAAKSYVLGALRQAPGLGKGKGPMGLLWTRPMSS